MFKALRYKLKEASPVKIPYFGKGVFSSL